MSERLKALDVELIQVDYTKTSDRVITNEIARTERKNLPINLIYPPNYPEEPAILLNELVTPADVMLVLDRMEEIQNSMGGFDSNP
ncbi:MAG: hypothetical protein AAFN77_00575 [Planctomycetota bacterium]